MKACLVELRDGGQCYYLYSTYTVIGNGLSRPTYIAAKMVLNDSTVSRLHCTIMFVRRECCYIIMDGIPSTILTIPDERNLSTERLSRNGVYINKRKVLTSRLEHRDIITLGSTNLMFSIEDFSCNPDETMEA